MGNFEDLAQQGLVIGLNSKEIVPYIEGIYITASDVKKENDNSYNISMLKYKGGLAAIFPKYKVEYKDGKWTLEIVSMAIT